MDIDYEINKENEICEEMELPDFKNFSKDQIKN